MIHVDDIGTVFKVTIKVAGVAIDISGATTKRIIFTGPNGRDFNKTALFDSDGIDGVLKYVSVSGDLYQAGTWEIQAFVILPSGSWHADITTFEVVVNL